MFDLLIRNATIHDGSGAPPTTGDLAVSKGRIAEVGHIPADAQAAETLDAQGHVLSPGFIDIHTHADIALLARPQHLPKIMQGVTTEVFTNCGMGFAPCTPAAMQIQKDYIGGVFGDATGVGWDWSSVADLLSLYEKNGIGTNVAYLIPHGAVRTSAMGMDARPATVIEIARMESLVREGMQQGAWGLSTGLWYAPMSFASHQENVSLCKAAGWFATHQRDYGHKLLESTEETLSIARDAGVPVQLSHLQMGVPRNEGRSGDVLGQLDKAREDGVDVAYDSYPYGAGSTMVQALLPGWATDGGSEAILKRLRDTNTRYRITSELSAMDRNWGHVTLIGVSSKRNAPLEGLTFAAAAEKRGMRVPEFICRVIEEDELKACFIAFHTIESDLLNILKHPLQSVGSDGLHLPGKTHPRLYGTYPRVIGHFVREMGAFPMEEAIRKVTSAPADRLGLKDRGRIAPGMAADLVLFDPAIVADVATYENPLQYPVGISHVWVNGVAAKRNDQPTGALAGQVLRKR
jgi:N-acyl-D-amino-acid deacylase